MCANETTCRNCGVKGNLTDNDSPLSYVVATCEKHPGAVSAHFIRCKKCNCDTETNKDSGGCYKCAKE